MPSLDLTHFKEIIEQLRNDDSFNAIGKLNLAAYLGERSHFLVAEIERLRAIESNLLEALEEVEWITDEESPDFQYCPWCGNYDYRGHASDCSRQVAIAKARGEA